MASVPASSPALLSIARRLEENSAHLRQLDASRAADKVQYQDFQVTLETLLVTIKQDRESFQQELKETTVVLEAMTAGQSNIQQAMARRDKEQKAEADVMRASISQLTALVRDLVLTQTSTPLPTTPVFPRTDADSLSLSDPSDSIGSDHKRSPDRTPCKRPPRLHKVSRTVEGMNTSDAALSLRQTP